MIDEEDVCGKKLVREFQASLEDILLVERQYNNYIGTTPNIVSACKHDMCAIF